MIDEIIALKSKARITLMFILMPIVVAFLVAWAVMLIILSLDQQLAEQLGTPPLWVTILYFAFGFFILALGIIFMIGYFRLPKVLIYRSGDQINFCGKFDKISDIDKIDFKEVYYAAIPLSTIKIILKDGTVLKNKYIADTFAVNQKLMEILFVYKEMRNK